MTKPHLMWLSLSQRWVCDLLGYRSIDNKLRSEIEAFIKRLNELNKSNGRSRRYPYPCDHCRHPSPHTVCCCYRGR